MEEHFRIAADFEFRHLEFGIGGDQLGRLPGKMRSPLARQFRGLVRAYGIQTPFCCLENNFTLRTPEAHSEQLRVTLEQIRWAAECGATTVRLFAGFTPITEMTDEIWSRLIDAVHQCQRLCEELWMVIGIETHGVIRTSKGVVHHIHSVTTRRDGLGRLLRELPEQVGFNYDPGNLKPLHPGDGQLCLDLLNDRINYCHLKDWRRVGDGWLACAPGDADLDYSTLLPMVKYEGVYLIEYEPIEDIREGIRRSLDYLRRICPDASLA